MNIDLLKQLIRSELAAAEERIDNEEYNKQLILEDLIRRIRMHLAAS